MLDLDSGGRAPCSCLGVRAGGLGAFEKLWRERLTVTQVLEDPQHVLGSEGGGKGRGDEDALTDFVCAL